MSFRLPSLAVLGGLFGMAGLMLLTLLQTGWIFEYPLDDVYIHLAMSEGIAGGGYGVNPNEFSSAASSILYPFLLVPFVGTGVHPFMPLIWNIIGLIAGSWLLGKIIDGTQLTGAFVVMLAFFGPLMLNIPGVAMAGMEHSLHMAASIAVLFGLIQFLKRNRISTILVAGIVLGPLLRYEGLAISAAACLVLLLNGRMLMAIVLGAIAVLPIVAFTLFLNGLGLDILPNSVVAKLERGGGDGLFDRLATNLQTSPGIYMAVIAVLAAAIFGLKFRTDDKLKFIALAVFLAGLAHLTFAQFGWLNRYEHYAMVFVAAGGVFLAGQFVSNLALRCVLLVVIMMPPLAFYLPFSAVVIPASAQAISLQQHQMARFVDDFYAADVAANDIGKLSYRNEHAVLDLWGLASAEALKTRLNDPEPGWAGELARKSDVDLAMIYESWSAEARGSDWVRIGELRLLVPKGIVSEAVVGFYATNADAVPGIVSALASFAGTVPEGAVFVFEEGFGG